MDFSFRMVYIFYLYLLYYYGFKSYLLEFIFDNKDFLKYEILELKIKS